MKKNFKYFSITWIVGFILFNAITFLIPNEVFGVTRFDKGVFWIAYALISLSFVAEIVTAYKFVKDDNTEKMFLNIPLLRIGYVAIIVSIFVGIVFMIFPVLPAWIGAISCLLVAGYFVIACVKATVLAYVIDKKEQQIKANTSFIKEAVIESANLIASATTEEIRIECQKIYDAFRFSDYVSKVSLKEVEDEISNYLSKMKIAVENANITEVKFTSKKLLNLIKERNIRCKASK